jgi:hypothetical protein
MIQLEQIFLCYLWLPSLNFLYYEEREKIEKEKSIDIKQPFLYKFSSPGFVQHRSNETPRDKSFISSYYHVHLQDKTYKAHIK